MKFPPAEYMLWDVSSAKRLWFIYCYRLLTGNSPIRDRVPIRKLLHCNLTLVHGALSLIFYSHIQNLL